MLPVTAVNYTFLHVALVDRTQFAASFSWLSWIILPTLYGPQNEINNKASAWFMGIFRLSNAVSRVIEIKLGLAVLSIFRKQHIKSRAKIIFFICSIHYVLYFALQNFPAVIFLLCKITLLKFCLDIRKTNFLKLT